MAMNKQELEKIVSSHSEWMETLGQKGTRADLSGADLSGADLSGANLFGANLSHANLSHANLYDANLYNANLYNANLYNADLSRADLSNANLSNANLSNADLSNANLYDAKNIIQFGPMPTSGRIIFAVRGEVTKVKAGCFWGTTEELMKKVKSAHNCPIYLGICDVIDAWAKLGSDA